MICSLAITRAKASVRQLPRPTFGEITEAAASGAGDEATKYAAGRGAPHRVNDQREAITWRRADGVQYQSVSRRTVAFRPGIVCSIAHRR